jgi:hypothetical protein
LAISADAGEPSRCACRPVLALAIDVAAMGVGLEHAHAWGRDLPGPRIQTR